MTTPLAEITSLDTGPLGIFHLRRYWARTRMETQGAPCSTNPSLEWQLDNLIIDGLGLGLEPTMQFLYSQAESYEQFEAWILEKNGGAISEQRKTRINQALRAALDPSCEAPALETLSQHPEPVLTETDLDFFAEHGYVIVKQAITAQECKAAEEALWQHIGATPDAPESWYHPKALMQHIMIQLFQHPALEANRRSPRIHRAFAQLWNSEKLWYTTDRISFNPPERSDYPFPGPDLHWDADLIRPFPFGLQGLLYLTDTTAEQGAFTCVPGFHKRIDDWLAALPERSDPQQQDLHALGSKPIPANAGDLIIWHHALPHGSRPNRADVPRLVQYIKLYPIVRERRA